MRDTDLIKPQAFGEAECFNLFTKNEKNLISCYDFFSNVTTKNQI